MTTRILLNRLVERIDLTRGEAAELMGHIMSGEVSQATIAAILTALRLKGETVDEIAGFATAMRERAIRITPSRRGVVDTCGTGGDAQQTFNISTATAFVSAAMGIPVAKHGNRAVSSRCGSADVLDALGIRIDLTPEAVTELIDTVGIGFLFAPSHHPAMKFAAPVRKDLGFRTVFNLLGPIVNPAEVKRQLVGVYDESLTETVAQVLRALGSEKVFVVHGRDGTDEVSIAGETTASYLDDGQVHTMTFIPEDAGVDRAKLSHIRGGTAAENAEHIMRVFEGQSGPRRDAIVLNAAFVAIVADRAKNLGQGAALAREAIDSGAALDVVRQLQEASALLADHTTSVRKTSNAE